MLRPILMFITRESGRILTLCYDVFARTNHGVTLCYRTTADELQKSRNGTASTSSGIRS